MASENVATKVEKLIKETVEEFGFELYDVEYLKKSDGMNLTIFIDKKEGITLDDCENVSRAIDPILDEFDISNGVHYILNVSSVGLDRPLKKDKDFKRCLGQDIEVKLFSKINEKKIFVGKLDDFDDENVYLTVQNDEKVVLSRNNIANAVLDFKF